ncbi:16S rRNA (guanine(966)-N(2))-methyltransferase RsmD [Candidatus Saccharibacteria bacterium]|nr:MAG: 16S rRNA (guanine(966)-N(2))-methyltransferase RsmD [Candidatus Saccharibacteria bacterium]PID99290.1 MAG: 16S rRNA (guanine(966)-N(2))-methyltransferase RsmD [Candidatus Saccharibacteria bacterium]
MRVIAGRLGGRLFASPHGHRTHPMSEKARGAIFNALGDVAGLSFLDAYAGSGALSIEAISRGGSSTLAIDVDTAAVKTIAENCKTLGITNVVQVLRKNVSGWSRNNQTQQFDIVMADPPYDDIRPDVLARLTAHVKPGGVYVLSWPAGAALPALQHMEQIAHKPLGDIHLVFYRKKT